VIEIFLPEIDCEFFLCKPGATPGIFLTDCNVILLPPTRITKKLPAASGLMDLLSFMALVAVVFDFSAAGIFLNGKFP